jgi:hypothetical protein
MLIIVHVVLFVCVATVNIAHVVLFGSQHSQHSTVQQHSTAAQSTQHSTTAQYNSTVKQAQYNSTVQQHSQASTVQQHSSTTVALTATNCSVHDNALEVARGAG